MKYEFCVGRPSMCLACLREKKVIAGRVAEAYEEADVSVRIIFDGLTGPGTSQRAVSAYVCEVWLGYEYGERTKNKKK